MATAHKLPSGNYRVLAYIDTTDGKRNYKSFTGPTKKEAEYQAALYKVRKKRISSSLTVGEAIDRYISSKSSVLSPKTVAEYWNIRKLAFPQLMKIKTDSLTNEDIQIAINEHSQTHSPKTVRNAVGLLTASLHLFSPDFRVSVTLPQRKAIEVSIPDDDAVKRLLDASVGTPMYAVILLASALGLRRSEMCALTWDDIKGNTIRINKAMVINENREWVIKSTKTTSSTRTLEVPGFIIDALHAQPDNKKVINIVNPAAVTLRFLKLRARVGFTGRLHDLRHYYASMLLAMGIPDLYSMKRMGHSTTNMLKTVYQHIVDEKQKEIDKQIDDKLTGLFG